MGSSVPGSAADVLALLPPDTDHRQAIEVLEAEGWTTVGVGDWATVLGSPDGTAAARISPFDPAGPYNVALYREAATTGQVPLLLAHRRLVGGGDPQLMELLHVVPVEEAIAFHRAVRDAVEPAAALAGVVRRVHARARAELAWCGPLDTNPDNVMLNAEGRLVVFDVYYADGPNLYAAAADDPDLVAERLPEHERRFMTEIPLASSGPWEAEAREAVRSGLAAADERRRSALEHT